MAEQFGSELGVTGLVEYSGQLQEQWVSSLRTSSQRVKKFDEMYRLDPTVASMISATAMFMCRSEILVEAASKSKADKDAAEFLESCFTDMTRDFYDIMMDIVLMMVYGFFDMEIVYWKRDGSKSKYDDGRIGWRKWAPRHPVTLDRWVLDAHGGLHAMVQQDPGGSGTYIIPIEKMLHFTTTGMGKNSPEGMSVLERAYTSWFYAKNLTIQEAIIVERMGGTPYIKLPDGADMSSESSSDLSRAKRLVRNIKTAENMGLTLPDGWDFGYETPKSGPAIDPGAVIVRHRRDIARTVLMDFIMLGGGDQGSWAMHSDKSALYIRSIGIYLKKIAGVINRHAVTRLFDLNAFPGISDYPRVYFAPITKIDIGGYSDVIAKLYNSGAITWDIDTENTVRREVGLQEIEEPGITYKPASFMPDENDPPVNPFLKQEQEEEPDEEESEDGEEEGKGEEKEKEEKEKEKFSDLSSVAASAVAESAYVSISRGYDRWAKQLAGDLAVEEEEEEWSEIVNAALVGLAAIILNRLRRGMFTVWTRGTGSDITLDGLRAIMTELEFQNHFAKQSLFPAITARALDDRRTLGDESATRDVIAVALAGSLAAFRHRAASQSNGIYRLWANHASTFSVYQTLLPIMERNGDAVTYYPETGRVVGENLQVRRQGPDDERSCAPCSSEISSGWRASTNPPSPVGSLECGGNDRCWIEYKYRGRIYA